MTYKKELRNIAIGPVILIIVTQCLSAALSLQGAQAVGVLCWMVFWWITRPVHIAITAMLPVIANAVLGIVPMESIISQYSAESIILIFGSGLICMPWASIGLDKRIAFKTLSIIGPSMKSQITVWLIASILLSTMLPNVAVCALFTPIAVSMLQAAGYEDIKSCDAATPILLAIGWGVGMGGAGSPLGGAMNLVAISFLEEHLGHEFMYIDWVMRTAPYFIISSIVLLLCMLAMPLKVKQLNGTKEYFIESYKALGPMKTIEKVCAGLFVLSVILAFSRPFYASIFPSLAPAYTFLIIGCIAFLIYTKEKGVLLTWEDAQLGTMWGMLILFGGGLAIGQLINGSGASMQIAGYINKMSLNGGLVTIILFAIMARVISEVTNSTASAAIMIPIILGFTSDLGLNPIPYWFILTMAYNAEFILPISVRAIPVAYGLDSNIMLKRGIPITIINLVVVIVFGYFALNYWPLFQYLSHT